MDADVAPIAVALDTSDKDEANMWAKGVGSHVAALKVGLQLYYRIGASGVRDVMRAGDPADLFLDLKLHDIPNTVAGAAASIADLEPRFVTVHAFGGREMVAAAVDQLGASVVAAVTVLTSLDLLDLEALGVTGKPDDAVRRLAAMSVGAGAGALVCSPLEVAMVRREVGPDITLITPGVRPASAKVHDQARVATPEKARRDGADLLVIGRPVTGAADPAAAVRDIAKVLAEQHPTLPATHQTR